MNRFRNSMLRLLALIVALSSFALLSCYAQTKPKKGMPKSSGFRSIFNGKDLNDWEGDPSRDGKQLVIARGSQSADVVLISEVK